MSNNDDKGSFDRLVSELSSDDRTDMLKKIKKNTAPAVQLVEPDRNDDYENVTLHLKYKNESVFYKFFLWVRSVFRKRNTEDIYNDDLLGNIAKQINREYPGIINHHSKVLDNIFYERLLDLKEAADFFKSYFVKIDENPGDFYVFLGSVIVPELFDSINKKVDPFSLSFEIEPTNEVRNNLLKKLDDSLKDINSELKARLYSAVSAVNWLEHFSRLPFIHFTTQFTNLAGANYTCAYKNAREDYEHLASVFANVHQIDSDVLEALILFTSQFDDSSNKTRVESENGNAESVDFNVERDVKTFVNTANEFLASIQLFISSVPIIRLGKVVNDKFDWLPESMEGVEAWFKSLRSSWRKIIDNRWGSWMLERRKNLLRIELGEDFKLGDFPLMKNRPWASLWTRVPFTSELTGGFLAWFSKTYYERILSVLNVVIMEGIFTNSENRTVYSEGLNSFVQAMTGIVELQVSLGSEGELGNFFEENVNNKIRSFQIQSKIDSVMSRIEVSIHDYVLKYINGCQMMEKIFADMFDISKNIRQEVLQNFMSIRGLKNREWRESLVKTRKLLKKGSYYLTELEAIEDGKS